MQYQRFSSAVFKNVENCGSILLESNCSLQTCKIKVSPSVLFKKIKTGETLIAVTALTHQGSALSLGNCSIHSFI